MNKIAVILDKEWAEVFKNRMVSFSVLLLPILFTALPLFILHTITQSGEDMTSARLPEVAGLCAGLTRSECTQVMMMQQFLMLFMLIPVSLPAVISAYSIVGEKTTRCLEPLLATPIETVELIAGKGLAAVIPAIVATWAAFGVFAIGARMMVANPLVFQRMFGLTWPLAVLTVGPLLAVASVVVSEIVSSRVDDPRAAEQISMLIIVPVLLVFFGSVAGLFLLDVRLVLVATAALLAVDSGLVYLSTRLFRREVILTTWR